MRTAIIEFACMFAVSLTVGTVLAQEAAPEADAEKQYGKYEVILDRMPFGEVPNNFNPDITSQQGGAKGGKTAEELTADEQKVLSSVKLSVLNVTPSGAVKVGFTDTSVKPELNLYMGIGEEQRGWKVISADPETQAVRLSKDDVEVDLVLGGGDAPKQADQNSRKPSVRDRLHMRQQAKAEELAKSEELRRQREEESKRREEEAAQMEQERQQKVATMREELNAIKENLKLAREERERAEKAKPEEGEQNDEPQEN